MRLPNWSLLVGIWYLVKNKPGLVFNNDGIMGNPRNHRSI